MGSGAPSSSGRALLLQSRGKEFESPGVHQSLFTVEDSIINMEKFNPEKILRKPDYPPLFYIINRLLAAQVANWNKNKDE